MRIAITGSNGRLGQELLKLDWKQSRLLPWTRKDADIRNENALRCLIKRDNPTTIIHLASITDTVFCERNKQEAWNSIVEGTLNIVRLCHEFDIRLVFVSTDWVFSGNESSPIESQCRPDPINYYGFCKAAAEIGVMTLPIHCILRCTMKPRSPWPHPVAPTDMWISHSYYDEVANILHSLVMNNKNGIFHFGNRDINIYEFASSFGMVSPVTRDDIKTISLPRDIRLKSNIG